MPENTTKLPLGSISGVEQQITQMPTPEQRRCAFCYPSEHEKHGNVRREWSVEWTMFIPLCRKHAQEVNSANLAFMSHDTPRSHLNAPTGDSEALGAMWGPSANKIA